MRIDIDTKYLQNVLVISHISDLIGKKLKFYSHVWEECIAVRVEENGELIACLPYLSEKFNQKIVGGKHIDNIFMAEYDSYLLRNEGYNSKYFLFDYIRQELVWDFDTQENISWFSYLAPRISGSIIAYDIETKKLYRFVDGVDLHNFASAMERVRIFLMKPESLPVEEYGLEMAARLSLAEFGLNFPKLTYEPDYTKYLSPTLVGSKLPEKSISKLETICGGSNAIISSGV